MQIDREMVITTKNSIQVVFCVLTGTKSTKSKNGAFHPSSSLVTLPPLSTQPVCVKLKQAFLLPSHHTICTLCVTFWLLPPLSFFQSSNTQIATLQAHCESILNSLHKLQVELCVSSAQFKAVQCDKQTHGWWLEYTDVEIQAYSRLDQSNFKQQRAHSVGHI